MKYIFLLLVLTIIVCQTEYPNSITEINKMRTERHQKLIECINEKGSDALKNLFKENKDIKIGKIFRDNFNSISEDDKKVFHECRKKIIFDFKFNRKNLLGFKNKGAFRRNHDFK